MSLDRNDLDFTRITDDAAILCRRRDFPRAVNVLQRRAPDRRRWRHAFRQVVSSGDHVLDGARRQWFEAALRELVVNVSDRRLAGELVIDAAAGACRVDLGPVLPIWTARDLWSHADQVDLPMAYVAQVTELPRSIRAPIDTARVIHDCRRTADAHRVCANEIGAALHPNAVIDEARGEADVRALAALQELRAHQDAARRWRDLAHRLFS
jgi:hypothetical protein